jgi:hypothetical protein
MGNIISRSAGHFTAAAPRTNGSQISVKSSIGCLALGMFVWESSEAVLASFKKAGS